MLGTDLKTGREQKGWTQEEAASKLRVSQPYLSLLEKGMRRVPESLAHKAASAYGLSATALPTRTSWESSQFKSEDALAADLASLGYPGFSHLKVRRKKNPAEVLIEALSAKSMDSRLAEALPWILVKYPNLDWEPLIAAAKVRDLQNKLGFVTSIARRLAAKRGEKDKVEVLRSQELVLERSRLLIEETLCHDSLTKAEKRWLKTNRPDEAKFWRLLTDLSPDHLSYAS